MLSRKISLTDYLSLSPTDKESLLAAGGFTKPSDLIDHDYAWLLNDYKENIWRVSMPNKDSASKRPSGELNVHFDTVVLGGGRLSDNQRLIDDMKLLVAITITANFNNTITLGSNSRVKVFVDSLKRYVSEALSTPYITNLEDLSYGDFFDLIQNAGNKLGYNLKYVEILEDYFEDMDIYKIPILRSKGKKQPTKIDTTSIFKELGINEYAFNNYESAKRVVALKSLELQRHYSSERFEVLYSQTLTEENERKMGHEKSYKDYLATLKAYSQAKSVYGSLFNYNFIPFDVEDIQADTNYEYPDFNEMLDLAERTRDIPPMLFLDMMDGAARFVLDYADDLFEAEKHFKAIYNRELDLVQGDDYQAGKRTNKLVRNYRTDDDRLHSPFPMSAYKHAQNREGNRKHSDNVYEAIANNMAVGVSRKKSMEDFKLTRGQYNSIRLSILANKTKKISLHKALYHFLPFCCVVIIFALTARRESEVFGLQVGCIKKDLDGLLWLNSFVAKTLQKHDDFTTVSLVEKAVSILERLSEKGRQQKNSDSIFVFDDTFDRPPTTMRTINRIADDFFDFIGIERGNDGKHWKLSEHQFRRFFAIMFYYRYEKADADALMHELAHVDWSMTVRYLIEKKTGAALRKLHQQYNKARSNRLVDYSLRDDLGGEGFPLLKEKLEETVSSMPEMMREIAIETVEANNLVFDFIPSGLCLGNTPWLSERCNCFRDGFVMQHDASSEMCEGCPAQVTVPEIAKGEMRPMRACGESAILKNLTQKAG
ncbi:tyrosine-type recombinase/integrase [Vibrio sp. Vb2110]|uniref:tyrosine-type recombinase/integrase n=1 Tax=unclassified Vibrio TaxID=2614977 RepID=UPI002964061D|nr:MULTISPECIES: tyrosine-type recombinase/integrase [unclassified Vibrio]MDW1848056.1 tyrosine-type recombinase/integrase [Vibrio sp. Vb2130]MDW1882174.1 tyrosine-type recombinase/integrase [Vibrio sp. Vb2110]MDW2039649.1 tyrosine-type recombinase/integrase [Vibrio sp. 2130-1]MDW2136680.1 tyrosine-type recombinase/integrase [Vibrio sp. 2128(2023)]